MPANATNVVALGRGPEAEHLLVLKADSTVVDWGNSNFGLNAPPPAAVDIVSVAAATFAGLALRADGTLVTWGQTNTLPAAATNIVAIAAGDTDYAALRADGSVLVWGISAPPATYGFTNLLDVACAFNDFGTPGVLGLKQNGTVVLYGGTKAPGIATNHNGAITAGGQDALVAVAGGPSLFPDLPVNR